MVEKDSVFIISRRLVGCDCFSHIISYVILDLGGLFVGGLASVDAVRIGLGCYHH